jgi:hypothetical protein
MDAHESAVNIFHVAVSASRLSIIFFLKSRDHNKRPSQLVRWGALL